MSWSVLPLLLAAITQLPKPVAHAAVSVQIVAGEEIRFEDIRKIDRKATLRQKRVRDGMPMVEFY